MILPCHQTILICGLFLLPRLFSVFLFLFHLLSSRGKKSNWRERKLLLVYKKNLYKKNKEHKCFVGEIPNKVALTFCTKTFGRCPKLFDADKSFRGKTFSLQPNLEVLQTIKIFSGVVTLFLESLLCVCDWKWTNLFRIHISFVQLWEWENDIHPILICIQNVDVGSKF